VSAYLDPTLPRYGTDCDPRQKTYGVCRSERSYDGALAIVTLSRSLSELQMLNYE